MKICDEKGHGEIVHDERHCPACDRISVIETEIERLKDASEEARDELANVT